MTTIFSKLISAAVLCLLSQSGPELMPVPKDFAIRVNYGDDIIDTFQNTFTRKGALQKHLANNVSILTDSTISFKISSAEKAVIYNRILKMNFTSYPSHLKPKCKATVDPSILIIITVRVKNVEKTISYDDNCIGTRDERSIKFKSLADLVIKTAGHRDEIKRMPASQNIRL